VSLQGTCWLRTIQVSASLAELGRSVVRATEQLGFRFFLYRGCFPNPCTTAHEVQLNNCPEDWVRDGVDHDVAIDPLYRRALREVTPIFWRELVPYESSWIARARSFGLATGVTLPVHGPEGRWSSLSLIKNRHGAGAEHEIRSAISKCHLLATFVHDVTDRILRNQAGSAIPVKERKSERCSLTERERDCLIWIAAGKTTAEVADVLSVAERTVAFHLANARRKLGVANSHHAIMRAVSLGHIKAA
jgi:DNA-binding CsgD family transcriptional regulator